MFSDRWNGFIYWLVIRRLHAEDNPLHTHSFVEIAFAVGGAGTHHCVAGRAMPSCRDHVTQASTRGMALW